MNRPDQEAATLDVAVYETHRDLIDRIVSAVARQQHLPADVAEDFASMVWERLLESNVMARFQQRCSVRTFLTVVIGNLYRDFRNRRWGKWRHSAEARRLGSVALRLELLMVRDGYTFDEAVTTLQTNFALPVSRDELYALSVRLPHRPHRRMVDVEELDMLGVPPHDIERAADREARERRQRRVREALARALETLPPQDRLILRMLFEDGLTVAQVAVTLGLPQKPLYRRRDMLFVDIRRKLEADGIAAADFAEIWDDPAEAHDD